MEYNNFYPPSHQLSHPSNPPHPPHGQQMQQQQPPVPPPPHGGSPGQMLHDGTAIPPQAIRQGMTLGPHGHHQHMQQQQQPQQHLGHHQQLAPQQQQNPNYHQVQPPHGPPMSHSGSPHPQQQQQQPQRQQQQPQQQPQSQPPPPHHHTNHHQAQLPPAGQPCQQGGLPQPHHIHPPSPHHANGPPPMHISHQQQSQPPMHPPHHPQQQQQPIHQIIRPPPMSGQSVLGHPPGHPAPPQNFFSNGPPISQTNMHHYPPPPPHHHSQHHTHPPQQHPHQPPQSMLHHHGPPPPLQPPLMSHHHPPHHIQQGLGRGGGGILGAPQQSTFYPGILQTEIRVIELNRRLQSRPMARHPASPLPNSQYDESIWWEKFTSEFFEDDATLTFRIQDDKPIDYTIGRTLIPRFFRTYFEGGVTDLSISLRNPKEACLHPQMITLDCDRAFITTTNNSPAIQPISPNQSVVVHTEGHLILDFVSNSFDALTIKSWKFFIERSQEYIDRSMTAMGLPTTLLQNPITKYGLTKSTIFYLKMCMIMEPMQDLMFQHKHTKMDPRSCLRKLLFDRYQFRSCEDNRVATNKRRKRKPSAAPVANAAQTTKKSKTNVNNIGGALNSTIPISPSGAPPGFSLASQDVMVVGEPTMMGGDFGDDNERMITRLENTQYDPNASTPVLAPEGSDITQNSSANNGNSIDSNTDRPNQPSPIIQQQKPPVATPGASNIQQTTILAQQLSPKEQVKNESHQQSVTQPELPTNAQPDLGSLSESQPVSRDQGAQASPTQIDLPKEAQIEKQPGDEQKTILVETQSQTQDTPVDYPVDAAADLMAAATQSSPSPQTDATKESRNSPNPSTKAEPLAEFSSATPCLDASTEDEPTIEAQSVKLEAVGEAVPVTNQLTPQGNESVQTSEDVNKVAKNNLPSIEQPDEKGDKLKDSFNDGLEGKDGLVETLENHSSTLAPLNNESNSNSQLACATTPSANQALEQQQPVNNGVA